MSLWPVHWRRNGKPARDDIGERYLAHLRAALMNLPSPHVGNAYTGEFAQNLQTVLEGRYRAEGAITMIGEPRLLQLSYAIRDLVNRDVHGDLLEAGAWRGGACIYMRAVLDVIGCRNRVVYVCDRFDDGFPPPDGRFPIDNDSQLHHRDYFKTSNITVRQYFRDYGYDDCQVKFVCGTFLESLPKAPIGKLALLRLDGDLYASTWDPLDILYDRVSPGGYVIADDYSCIRHSQQAVDDFRAQRKITAPLRPIDWSSVYWIKEWE